MDHSLILKVSGLLVILLFIFDELLLTKKEDRVSILSFRLQTPESGMNGVILCGFSG